MATHWFCQSATGEFFHRIPKRAHAWQDDASGSFGEIRAIADHVQSKGYRISQIEAAAEAIRPKLIRLGQVHWEDQFTTKETLRLEEKFISRVLNGSGSTRHLVAESVIEKAVALAPDDAYIQDSLGWVEFRIGNTARATEILRAAYEKRPDAEIAAHLGEVLWAQGQRDEALKIWREGLLLASDNETLQGTLQRLRVKP